MCKLGQNVPKNQRIDKNFYISENWLDRGPVHTIHVDLAIAFYLPLPKVVRYIGKEVLEAQNQDELVHFASLIWRHQLKIDCVFLDQKYGKKA